MEHPALAQVRQGPRVHEELGTLDHAVLVYQIRSKVGKSIQC